MVEETFEKKFNKKSPHVEEKMNGFTNILLEKLSRFLAFYT
jgi:ATP-dependent RNA circularization protein (DNA/RNA ligase family)